MNYNDVILSSYVPSDFLCHHGILGQKWGIRRFQNPDGTLTPEGRERYGLKAIDTQAKIEKYKNKNARIKKKIDRLSPRSGKINDKLQDAEYDREEAELDKRKWERAIEKAERRGESGKADKLRVGLDDINATIKDLDVAIAKLTVKESKYAKKFNKLFWKSDIYEAKIYELEEKMRDYKSRLGENADEEIEKLRRDPRLYM